MGYFIFNGVSSAEFGVLESAKIRKRASRASDYIKIPGRASPLSIQRSEMDETVMDFVIGLRGRGNIDSIYKWLSGAGRLITSENTNQYMNATCNDEITPERAGRSMGKVAVSFRCDPFAYAIANDPTEYTTSPATFKTIGTIYSEPIITITGSGEITLTVNGVALRITDVVGNVTIDVPRRLAYSTDGNGKKTVCLDHTYGNLWDMLLVPDPDAFNRVSWAGNATSVSVQKNERWL